LPSLSDLLFRTVDGAYGVNSRQRIVLWNEGCSHLLGIPADDVLGRKCCDILQGKSPTGKPFCSDKCNVAQLAVGGCATRTFPLRVSSAEGEKLKLWVNIILVPSLSDDSWICVHLLRRDAALNVLDAINGSLPEFRSQPEKRLHDIAASESTAHSSLTSREHMVVELLAEGLSTSAMSEVLDIRPVTVRNHIQHIQAKLGVHSKVETVAYAYRHNLLRSAARDPTAGQKEMTLPA